MALASHDPADPSFSTATARNAANLAGPLGAAASDVRRLVLCTGKLAYDLLEARDKGGLGLTTGQVADVYGCLRLREIELAPAQRAATAPPRGFISYRRLRHHPSFGGDGRTFAEMTAEVARACWFVGTRVAGPMVVTGHSAGGQLSARMGNDDVAPDVAARAARHIRKQPITPSRTE